MRVPFFSSSFTTSVTPKTEHFFYSLDTSFPPLMTRLLVRSGNLFRVMRPHLQEPPHLPMCVRSNRDYTFSITWPPFLAFSPPDLLNLSRYARCPRISFHPYGPTPCALKSMAFLPPLTSVLCVPSIYPPLSPPYSGRTGPLIHPRKSRGRHSLNPPLDPTSTLQWRRGIR